MRKSIRTNMYLKSPFAFLFTLYYNLTPQGLSPLIPLCGLFLLRTSAIQASLIALGLASVLLSPFSFPPYAPRSLSPTNECVARR